MRKEHEVRKRLPFPVVLVGVLTVAITTGVAFSLTVGSSGGVASADDPERVIGVSGTPEPSEPGAAQDHQLPSQPGELVFQPRPEFSGNAVRVLQTFHQFGVDSSDPNNGKLLLSEAWYLFDEQGVPEQYAQRVFWEDGTLVQVSFQDRETITAWSPLVESMNDTPCFIAGRVTAEHMEQLLPPFLPDGALDGLGYTGTTSVSRLPENTIGSLDAVPVASFLAGSSITALTRSDHLPSGDVGIRTLEFDRDSGMLRSWSSEIRDPSGGVVKENGMTVSRVDVFDRNDVPSSILSPAETEGC